MIDNIKVKCVFLINRKKKIELNQIVTIKGKWNRAKQEINGNRIFNDTHTSTEEVRLEPVYRLKEGIKQNRCVI